MRNNTSTVNALADLLEAAAALIREIGGAADPEHRPAQGQHAGARRVWPAQSETLEGNGIAA